MILLDVNVVLAAHRADHPHHEVVRAWLGRVVKSGEQFGVADSSWASFVRLATNRRIFPVPSSAEDAFGFLRAIRAQPNHVTPVPGERHLATFERLCAEYSAVGDLAPDAYLAAIALEIGAEVVTLDRDFARFEPLRWRLPG